MARLPGDTFPLLVRLWRTWLYPHRGTLAVVLVLIALVGGSTGLYPALIKAAFDAFDRTNADRDRIIVSSHCLPLILFMNPSCSHSRKFTHCKSPWSFHRGVGKTVSSGVARGCVRGWRRKAENLVKLFLQSACYRTCALGEM